MIIAFGYKRESGKNTALDMALRYLRSPKYQALAHEESFASPLKQAAKIVFGFGYEQLSGPLKGEVDPFWGFTPRWALQTLGTDAMRHTFGPDVWVKNMERRLHAYFGIPFGIPWSSGYEGLSVLIGDLRFENEAAMVRRLGGYLVKCTREVPYVSEIDDHPSEHDLDDFREWDFTLDNNGSFDALEVQVGKMIDSIMGR